MCGWKGWALSSVSVRTLAASLGRAEPSQTEPVQADTAILHICLGSDMKAPVEWLWFGVDRIFIFIPPHVLCVCALNAFFMLDKHTDRCAAPRENAGLSSVLLIIRIATPCVRDFKWRVYVGKSNMAADHHSSHPMFRAEGLLVSFIDLHERRHAKCLRGPLVCILRIAASLTLGKKNKKPKLSFH